MSTTTAKGRLDRGGGEPVTGYISKEDIQTSYDDLEDAWQADDATEAQYGDHLVVWNGTDWRYKGATVVARPTTASFTNGARVVWDTSLDDTVTTPPTLAVAGDVWIPHGEVTP